MEQEENERCCHSPKAIFRWRVIADIIKVSFCWFGIVSLIAYILNVTHLKEHDSYFWALGIVIAIMGIFGILHGFITLFSGHRHQNLCCCDGCNIWMFPMNARCNCGDNRSGSVLSVILFIAAIILIIIGVVYAMVISYLLIWQMAARHYSRLNAQLMTRYVFIF